MRLFILIAASAILAGCAADDANERLHEYFSDVVKNGYEGCQHGEKIDVEDIGTYREKVWDLWREANRAEADSLLPSPGILDSSARFRWELPESLEPDAVMNFYWGRKGGDGTLPLFVYLHGSGPRDAEWATGLKLAGIFEDSPCMYFIPQIPNAGEYYRWWQKSKQFAWERLLRLALSQGYADPERIYFFGISEGGYGSQRLASFYADYMAGAGPMAGGEPLVNAPAENCANIAFSLRTGEEDYGFYRNILTGYTKEAFDRLASETPGHYIHNIELIPGMGHGIDYRPTTPWLLGHKRNPCLEYVAWEDFAMDGRHRKGFGCIEVMERPDSTLRTFYQVRFSGNKVDIRVDNVIYECTEKDPVWGIELKHDRKYVPAAKGRFRIYLPEDNIDLGREICISVNGKEIFKGRVGCDIRYMAESCALYFDPERVFASAVDIDLETGTVTAAEAGGKILSGLNLFGIVTGLCTFLIIGIFHVLVVKAEYHLGVGSWWLFLIAGILAGGASLAVTDNLLSTAFGVFAFSSFWSILEVFHQRKRVLKGWFPKNPRRKY